MRLLVVGAGAMGRWFARCLDDTIPDLQIWFTDTDESAAADAARTLDATTVDPETTNDDLGEPFDLVCIAVPIPVAEEVVAQYAPVAEQAICDVTGSMAGPVAAMGEHAPDVERLSLHPLFAPENAPGNVAVVSDGGGPVTDAVREALAAAGNDIFETTPEDHDEAMETVQARAHAAVLAFALVADDVPDEFHTPVSAALFDLVEQVTSGDAHVYADIQHAFAGADDVAAAARQIAEADPETFAALYDEAG